MYDIRISSEEADLLREFVEFLDDILEAVDIQDELNREDCE